MARKTSKAGILLVGPHRRAGLLREVRNGGSLKGQLSAPSPATKDVSLYDRTENQTSLNLSGNLGSKNTDGDSARGD